MKHSPLAITPELLEYCGQRLAEKRKAKNMKFNDYWPNEAVRYSKQADKRKKTKTGEVVTEKKKPRYTNLAELQEQYEQTDLFAEEEKKDD